jgi:glycosyltransferase involved in cell wall biosynthesis
VTKRVSLLIISGDPSRALAAVKHVFPAAEIGLLNKGELKYGSVHQRVTRLRQGRPAVFTVFGRSLEVLRSSLSARLLILATLSGSRELWLFDESGAAWSCWVRPSFSWLVLHWLLEVPMTATLLVGLGFGAPLLALLARRAQRRGRTATGPDPAPLKIAYLRSLGSAALTATGGTASHTIGIVTAIAGLGHSVHVLTRPPAPDFGSSPVRVSVIPYDRTFFTWHPITELENHLRFAWRAWALLRRQPPDLLYQRHTRSDVSGAFLSVVLRRPLFLEHEGSERLLAQLWDPTPLPGMVSLLEWVNHSSATAVFALSREIRRDLIEERHVPADKVLLMPSGVDTTRFRPGVGDPEQRERLGVDRKAILVGFSGTFGPWHGTETLIEAILSLPAEAPFHFLFIGDGDGRMAAQTRLQTAEVPHANTFTGLVPLASMPAYLDACDILTCPTIALPGGRAFFGSPTKLFEYMAAGKAIVASRVGQIQEVVRHEETGLLVEPGDAAALRDALLRLAKNSQLRVRLGESAREEVLARYSWEKNAHLTIASYRAAVRGDRLPSCA